VARIRTIKPEFWTDDKIINLPFVARLFFIGLWNFADDHGCIQDKPDQLKLLVLPADDSFDVYQTLDLLLAADLIERFIDEETDSTFLVVKNWTVHQKVDHPAKSKILKSEAKKANIPLWVRRKVAEKYGCQPGKTKQNECYFCGTKGSIYWATKRNGEPSSWVSFSHELAHIIPESKDGTTDDTNIVLACRNCNRSMGVKNAFDWLFDSKYSGNHYSPTIQRFREASRGFENNRSGKEGKGKEGKGSEGGGELPPTLTQDEIEFNEVVEWMKEKCPRVLQMKEPLTQAEYFKLKDRYEVEYIPKILQAMHNWSKLTKDRVNAYLTFLAFAKRDKTTAA
jgi:hypothetical protein